MKPIACLFLALLAGATTGLAQTRIEKSVPIRAGQRLVLNVDYPDVQLQTWDKPDIQITGTASINRGEHDDAFQLDIASTSEAVTVTSQLKDKDRIPERILIKRDEQEYFFKTADFHDPEVQKFLAEKSGDYAFRSTGVHQEIKLTIFVPRHTPVEVNAKYGVLEAVGVGSPLKAVSKYGVVDVTVAQAFAGSIVARCQYGEILTNLDAKFDRATGTTKSDKRWTEISTRLGSGPAYHLESKYGNVYVRKSK